MKNSVLLLLSFCMMFAAEAALKVGDKAFDFNLKNQEGKSVALSTRQDKWTVLYFYPKASTPGCTKQACAFRDNIKLIRAAGAEVYGVSADAVDKLKTFHNEHKLTFDLLSDLDASVIAGYDVKMPMINMGKRITFIIGPDLHIKYVALDVDPSLDAQVMIDELSKLQGKAK
jgi:peroxiredoxin Q/BCP